MDEIYIVARSNDQVGESEGARLHRFRLVSGEDAGTFRSKQKMDRSTPRISTVQFLQRIIRKRWRTD